MRRVVSPELRDLLANRFAALAVPARLAIMHALHKGERPVGMLVDVTGVNQASVSKHLAVLHAAGWVRRRREGLHVYYRLADRSVFRICEIICSRLDLETRARRRALRRR